MGRLLASLAVLVGVSKTKAELRGDSIDCPLLEELLVPLELRGLSILSKRLRVEAMWGRSFDIKGVVSIAGTLPATADCQGWGSLRKAVMAPRVVEYGNSRIRISPNECCFDVVVKKFSWEANFIGS